MAVLSDKLRERGYRVVPICSPNTALFHDLRRRGFNPVTLAADGYFRPGTVRNLARWFRRHPPDLLHLHYSRDLWSVVPAMLLSKRLPVVLIKHVGTQKPKRDPLHRWLFTHVDYVITISEVIHRNVLQTHPVSPDRVGLVYHGVDLARFNPRQADREAVRAELGIGAAELIVGIVGRIQRSKGYPEFLAAARRLSHDFNALRFLLVGGPTRGEEAEAAEILSAIDAYGLRDRVIVAGYRDDVPRMLAAMDVFVFPSHAEAFGLVLIEAMAMELPVVSSDCDGVLDIVVDAETGFRVPPGDVTTLTHAISRLLRDPSLRRRFGKAGRVRVEAKFDLERSVGQVEAIYHRVWGVSETPAPIPT